MTRLFMFVEGDDDERFFMNYYREFDDIKYVKYSQMSQKQITGYIKAINNRPMCDYVFVSDADGATIDEKKQKIKEKHPICDINKIYISQREIESWYLAGLNSEKTAQYKMKYILCTDDISKEKFCSMIPKRYTPLTFKIEILKQYDLALAQTRNTSLKIFTQKRGTNLQAV